VRELVVVAVVALETIITGKITLQRRKYRHAQLLGVLAHAGEMPLQAGALTLAALHDEAVLDQRVERLALLRVECGFAMRHALEQVSDVGRHQ
jgi:hypothetical protein